MDWEAASGIGGCETMEELLKIDPKVNGILMFEDANNAPRAGSKSFGFKAQLAKPCTCKELLNVLAALPASSAPRSTTATVNMASQFT